MKRYWRAAAAFLMTLFLSAAAVYSALIPWHIREPYEETVPVPVEAGGKAKKWEENTSDIQGRGIHVTVLGDSIAKGYSSDQSAWIECYGRIAAKRIALEEEGVCFLQNYAKNGLATDGLNERILTQKQVLMSLEKSDIIFITIGSNDLLNECKAVVQEILDLDTKFKSADEALAALKDSVGENPLLILNVIDALSNWDYLTFDSEWTKMMDTVTAAKRDGARIIVTDIYNPAVNMDLPSTMNQVVDDIIGNMNMIIQKHAAEYGYQIAAISESTITAHVQDDGLHPDQMGQQIIADLVYEEYMETAERR